MQTMHVPASTPEESRREFAERNLGAVYTPASLADWVARLFIEKSALPSSAVVCDPACGDGELLRAVHFNRPDTVLLGIDLDRSAIDRASERAKEKFFFRNCDALQHDAKRGIPSWSSLFGQQMIHGIIANPPWGADLSGSRKEFTSIGYTLAKGQYDSWNLFVEAALHNLGQHGTAAFIIPDAIFLPEHTRLRELLHQNTQILLIARLGEGFFRKVFRGTTIVIFRKGFPARDHQVEVLRLNKQDRTAVLSGSNTLDAIRKEKSHCLPQYRFKNDPSERWDIDSSASEEVRIHAFTAKRSNWTKWLCSGRGVELSKFGKIYRCPVCQFARPASKRKIVTCANCGHIASPQEFHKDQIVKQEKSGPNAFPFLVGEDVGRYFASPSRHIIKAVAGINYKTEDVYNHRRLLIRKTGVGIKAAIVNKPSMTNQVVFHYYENPDANTPPFFLSYCLGVLCSRTMLAYHLRTNGENEWRSHPYITQKVIAGLPLPLPKQGTRTWKQAQGIANLVDSALAKGTITKSLDLKIEALVAALFDFDESSYSWITDVLNQAEALEPIRALRLNHQSRVVPRWVD